MALAWDMAATLDCRSVWMFLRAVSSAGLALVLLAGPFALQPAFPQTDNDGAPSAISSEAEPADATRTPPIASPVEAAKPRLRVKAKRPTTVNAEPTGVNFFGNFNLLRLFGISAIPRSTVAFSGNYKPGTIVIHTNERRLYLVLGNGEALRYGIGVGREGFTWKGVNTVTDKREWPSWTPPPQMLARKPGLPRHMAGGPDNPLGARAMYLGDTLYRIHGTNEYDTIGSAESSGCIRLTNDDVIDLYNRVRIGTTVIVQ
jgi:lipoprotein-anchoring transpeptidase ErfK/SrfK